MKDIGAFYTTGAVVIPVLLFALVLTPGSLVPTEVKNRDLRIVFRIFATVVLFLNCVAEQAIFDSMGGVPRAIKWPFGTPSYTSAVGTVQLAISIDLALLGLYGFRAIWNLREEPPIPRRFMTKAARKRWEQGNHPRHRDTPKD